MTARKITVLDGHILNPGDNPWDPIEQLGALTLYPQTPPDRRVLHAKNAEVIVTNKVVLDAETIEQLPELRFITVTATGVNVVDLEAAKRANVLVSNVPDYSTDSVAQHVFAGLLSFIHRPEHHHDAIHQGAWQRANSFCFWDSPLTELAGKTMGIVGWGRIGMATARLAHAFGMQVIATPSRNPAPSFSSFQWRELDQLLAEADVISLHCPLTESNAGMIHQARLATMKPNAILINTARGGLINEHDLAQALNDDQIAGAVVDVVSAEPITEDNPLLGAKNCLITPHMAWATVESRRRLMALTAQNIQAFFEGHPIHLV